MMMMTNMRIKVKTKHNSYLDRSNVHLLLVRSCIAGSLFNSVRFDIVLLDVIAVRSVCRRCDGVNLGHFRNGLVIVRFHFLRFFGGDLILLGFSLMKCSNTANKISTFLNLKKKTAKCWRLATRATRSRGRMQIC